jgi:hypothetical protein
VLVLGLGIRMVVVVLLLLLLHLVVRRWGEGNGGAGLERGVAQTIRAGGLMVRHCREGLGRRGLERLCWFEFGLWWP